MTAPKKSGTSSAVGTSPSVPASAAAAASSTALEKASATSKRPSAHAPSVVGSVLEASNGVGGKALIRLQNMSATANLGVPLDLKRIALKCRNTEYNPKKFAAVIMRLREPRATALIFASGKMCVTGCKSAHNTLLAAKKFCYIIEKVGFKPQEHIDFKIQNIVGTVDVGFPIRLEGLVYAHSTFASYEPELFPGLIYRLVSPRVVLLIFVSGKIVLTGARTERDLTEAFSRLHPVLLEFKKAYTAPPPGSQLAIAAARGGGEEEEEASTANDDTSGTKPTNNPPTVMPSTTAKKSTTAKATTTKKRKRKKSTTTDGPTEQV